MLRINLENKYRKWINEGPGYFTGMAFDKSCSVINAKNVLSFFENTRDFKILENKLLKLSGSYSIIVNDGNFLFAAVDRFRSIPLFYGKTEKSFFISDDAEWIRLQMNDSKMNHFAEQEFLLTGYVTGKDTLFPDVKQLLAGEYLIVKENGTVPEIINNRYFRFQHKTENETTNEKILYDRLYSATLNSIKKLINYANGRQIIIPLSSGFDSRLIVSMLKLVNYKDVICLNYGTENNPESETSRFVAENLSYPWLFIKYSKELWREWWNTEERHDYYSMASGWSILPHAQDWPAVWELKKKRLINNDAIFVPGHIIGFISGSTIPQEAFYLHKFNENMFVSAILNKHYSLISLSNTFFTGNEKWQKRIKSFLEKEKVRSGEALADVCEKWGWQERQSKYIINSVRVYEYWGYDWFLFNDSDLFNFWLNTPLKLRKGKIFYGRFVNDMFLKASGVSAPVKKLHKETALMQWGVGALRKTGTLYFVKDLFGWFLRLSGKLPGYESNIAFYGQFSDKMVEKYRNIVKSPVGFIAIDYLIKHQKYSNLDLSWKEDRNDC